MTMTNGQPAEFAGQEVERQPQSAPASGGGQALTVPTPLSSWSLATTAPTVCTRTFNMQPWFAGLVAVVAVGIAAGGFVNAAGSPVANGTIVLGLITGTAVVIERLLEAFWNFEDSTKGAWWPFDLVHAQVQERVDHFGDYIQPSLNRLEWARRALNEACKENADRQPELEAIGRDINALPNQLEAVKVGLQNVRLGNNQKLDYLLSTASDRITALLNAHPDLQAQLGKNADVASTLTSDVYSFVSSFQDNPPRRIISLAVGCLAGFVVALVLRLDLFAALGVHSFGPFALGGTSLQWGLGVPLTGLIMGLGSNPTHEIIQAIQQYKQSSAAGS
jgi:hypothetical protein